jgi:hypothetical protein
MEWVNLTTQIQQSYLRIPSKVSNCQTIRINPRQIIADMLNSIRKRHTVNERIRSKAALNLFYI